MKQCLLYTFVVYLPITNTLVRMSSFDNNEINNNAFWYDKKESEYEMGLAMWIKYGLTKERYDADLEHRANITALDEFNADPENYLAPEYGEMLEEKIRKFEEDARERERENEEQYCFPDDYQDEDYYEESYEDMAERYRLERFEHAIENARDDMHDN